MATYALNEPSPQEQIRVLSKQLWELTAAEREKQLALEEVRRLNKIIDGYLEIFKLPIPDDWKIALCILPCHIERRQQEHSRPDGLTHVVIRDYARDVGKTPENAGQTLKRMHDKSDLLEHEVVQVGQHDKRVYVRLCENPAKQIKKTKLVNPTNLGGHRTCPNCKRDLRKVTYYRCDECKLDFDEDGNMIEPGTPLPLEPMQAQDEAMKPPIQLPMKSAVKVPHCKNVFCLTKPNRTQVRLNGMFFCPDHHGFIDENGRPI